MANPALNRSASHLAVVKFIVAHTFFTSLKFIKGLRPVSFALCPPIPPFHGIRIG